MRVVNPLGNFSHIADMGNATDPRAEDHFDKALGISAYWKIFMVAVYSGSSSIMVVS